ncbi:inner centromere protein A-like [Macrobrachium rosenbergii]|uniref:inner centromere protein A-like n=1 Tax=Macrobrachium rosenbergii TaxID=79674 RepID=UPI0034D734AE
MVSLQDKLEEAQVRESNLVARMEAMEKKMAEMARTEPGVGEGSEDPEAKGTKEKIPKKGKELRKSKGGLAFDDGSMIEVDESDREDSSKDKEGRKKKTRKGRNVRKEELISGVLRYSSGSEVEEQKNESGSSSSSSEGLSEAEEKEAKTMFLREVPKIEKFNIGKGSDIYEFFDEYDKYCRQKYGENESVRMKRLGEFLGGRLKTCYRSMCEGEPGVEALARRKYGEEGIEENKHLMQKFLATIPEKIRVILNEKEKDWKRWSEKRLEWEDALETLKDMRIVEDEAKEMFTGSEVVNGRTYKDALVSEELSVMRALLEECRKDGIERGRKNVHVNVGSKGKRSSSRSRERFRSGNVGRASGNMRERLMGVGSSSKGVSGVEGLVM